MMATIVKPMRAANIFGALSIARCGKRKASDNQYAKQLSGLKRNLVNARTKKSINKKPNKSGDSIAKPISMTTITSKEVKRGICSFTRSVDMGQNMFFIFLLFSDKDILFYPNS